MSARIRAIEYYLPEVVISNAELAAQHPDWSIEKIETKTGIHQRHIVQPGECASDLAVAAASKLFANGCIKPEEIDFLLMCTQSPDYFLPTTACLVQERLGLPTTIGALDFNLGCSGFVYGLAMAKGLIEAGLAGKVLLLTAETYSKFIHPSDRSVRTIFGDGAAATLIERVADSSSVAPLGPFVFGTDGSGGKELIVPFGAMRHWGSTRAEVSSEDPAGNHRGPGNLYMNGAAIFEFTLKAVPAALYELLRASGRQLADIDLFVFHQANAFMLEHLRRKLKIPRERFVVALRNCGNTVSSTIPIALKDTSDEGRLAPGMLIAVLGFGVGYSWSAALVRWM